MNCEHPKLIIHRSNHWNDTMPLRLLCPCGKCENCRRNLRRDWFVRCYYEWQKNFTSTYFYTLTYNEENLPRYCGVPHFSKRHIQLFLKRLRKILDSRGIKLKYMITSEFGELHHRPHYHALFFLENGFISPYTFYKVVEESWSYGFVKYGDDMGKVFSVSGISYVTKYVSKDFGNIDKLLPSLCFKVYERYNRFLFNLGKRYGKMFQSSLFYNKENGRFYACDFKHKLLQKDNPDYSILSNIVSKCNNIVLSRSPFHLQSTKLGRSFFDKNAREHLDQGLTYILDKKGVAQPYRLPRYYKRLFFYDVVENEVDGKKNRFVLNDNGKKHIFDNLDRQIERAKRDIQYCLMNHHLVDKDTLLLVNQTLPNNLNFGSVLSLVDWLRKFDLDTDMLAVYSTVFRFRYMPLELCDQHIDKTLLVDNYKDVMTYCLYHVSEHDFGKLYEKFGDISKQQAFSLMMWNAHPDLVIYEYAQTIFDAIFISITRSVSLAKKDADKNAQKLREFMRNL